jgi:hypothetical protein
MGSLAACDDDITGATGVVTAIRDRSFNFATLNTFAMPDTVVQLTAVTGSPIAVSRTCDRTALDQVRANLVLRGYTEVANPRFTKPDFIVLVGSTATTSYDAYVTYPWYDVWGFYPGWGWYAPGFNSTWNLVYPYVPQVALSQRIDTDRISDSAVRLR